VAFVAPWGESIEIIAPSRLEDRFGAAAPVWCGLLGGYGGGAGMIVTLVE
jgi:hypothetical protein